MKKYLKIELIINIIVLLTIIPIIILISLNSNNIMYYNYLTILCYLTLVIPMSLLFCELYNVAKIDDYKHYNYFNVCMLFIIILGIGIYLILVNTSKTYFYKFNILYFIALILAIISPIIICIYLEKKSNKQIKEKTLKKR